MMAVTLAAGLLFAHPAASQEATLTEVRVVPTDQGSALELALTGPVGYSEFRLDNPARLVIDLTNVRSGLSRSAYAVGRGGVGAVRTSQFAPGVFRVVVDLETAVPTTTQP